MYLYNNGDKMAQSAQLYQYPLDLGHRQQGIGSGDHRITFQILVPQTTNANPATGDMVAMYLPPEALKTSYSQGFGDVEMGGIGQAIMAGSVANAEQAGSAAMEGRFMDALKGTVAAGGGGQNLLSAFKSVGAKALAKGVEGKNEGAIKALERKVGKIRNQHKALIYQGPGGFRTFSFNFVMMPKSRDEAVEVNKIVHFFKYHMHPDVGGQTGSMNQSGSRQGIRGSGLGQTKNTSITLSYPEEFKIRISPAGRDGSTRVGTNSDDGNAASVRPLFRIENCFLESLNVDYTSGGQPAFFADNAEPVTTQLALTFKETQLITKESIRQGF